MLYPPKKSKACSLDNFHRKLRKTSEKDADDEALMLPALASMFNELEAIVDGNDDVKIQLAASYGRLWKALQTKAP